VNRYGYSTRFFTCCAWVFASSCLRLPAAHLTAPRTTHAPAHAHFAARAATFSRLRACGRTATAQAATHHQHLPGTGGGGGGACCVASRGTGGTATDAHTTRCYCLRARAASGADATNAPLRWRAGRTLPAARCCNIPHALTACAAPPPGRRTAAAPWRGISASPQNSSGTPRFASRARRRRFRARQRLPNAAAYRCYALPPLPRLRCLSLPPTCHTSTCLCTYRLFSAVGSCVCLPCLPLKCLLAARGVGLWLTTWPLLFVSLHAAASLLPACHCLRLPALPAFRRFFVTSPAAGYNLCA